MHFKIALIAFLLSFTGQLAFSQSPTPDSTSGLPKPSEIPMAKKDSDSLSWLNDTTFQSKKHSPRRATLYSAVIPGLGQVYNRQYYKVPILAAAGVFLGILIMDNDFDYQQAKRDNETRQFNKQLPRYGTKYFDFDGDSLLALGIEYKGLDAYDPFNPLNAPGKGRRSFDDDQLRQIRDGYRRDRDFYIIVSALVYALNIVDAAVFAHLREFEVNDKLSMKIDPDIRLAKGTNTLTAGLTLSLNFTQK